jgi:hypothetical protein
MFFPLHFKYPKFSWQKPNNFTAYAMAINNWCHMNCHYLWCFIRNWKFRSFTFTPCSGTMHRTTKGTIWSYFLLAASVIMLTGTCLLKSSRMSSIFTDVITLRENSLPRRSGKGQKLLQRTWRFISTNCQLGRSSSTASALLKMIKKSWRTGGCCQTSSMFCTIQMDFYVI